MLTIQSEEALENYRNQRALISLYLDHGYSTENITVIFNAQRAFDAHVSSAWHMLIPYENGYAVDAPLDERAYGIQLARNIISSNNIPHQHLPLLMFEGSNPSEPKFYVHFNGRSQQEIISLVGKIADIAVQEWRDGRSDIQEFRADVADRVRVMLNREKALVILGKVAPKVAGAIGAAADMKSLLD